MHKHVYHNGQRWGVFFLKVSSAETFPKTIIDSENGAWETPFLLGNPIFQVLSEFQGG